MIQPFCYIIEQQIRGDILQLTIQTRRTIDTVDDAPGVMVDNSIYRKILIDLANGDIIETYTGPITL